MEEASAVFYLGDDTLGLTLTDKLRRNTLAARLRQSGNWLNVIPGAHGLSVQYDPLDIAPIEAKARLEAALASKVLPAQTSSKHWDIPVCYAPEFALDMPEISRQTGYTAQEIIASHTSAAFTVDMIGFTPWPHQDSPYPADRSVWQAGFAGFTLWQARAAGRLSGARQCRFSSLHKPIRFA